MRSRDACLREAGGLPGAAQPPTTAAEIVKAARAYLQEPTRPVTPAEPGRHLLRSSCSYSNRPQTSSNAVGSHDFLSAASSDGVTSWGSHISVAGHADIWTAEDGEAPGQHASTRDSTGPFLPGVSRRTTTVSAPMLQPLPGISRTGTASSSTSSTGRGTRAASAGGAAQGCSRLSELGALAPLPRPGTASTAAAGMLPARAPLPAGKPAPPTLGPAADASSSHMLQPAESQCCGTAASDEAHAWAIPAERSTGSVTAVAAREASSSTEASSVLRPLSGGAPGPASRCSTPGSCASRSRLSSSWGDLSDKPAVRDSLSAAEAELEQMLLEADAGDEAGASAVQQQQHQEQGSQEEQQAAGRQQWQSSVGRILQHIQALSLSPSDAPALLSCCTELQCLLDSAADWGCLHDWLRTAPAQAGPAAGTSAPSASNQLQPVTRRTLGSSMQDTLPGVSTGDLHAAVLHTLVRLVDSKKPDVLVKVGAILLGITPAGSNVLLPAAKMLYGLSKDGSNDSRFRHHGVLRPLLQMAATLSAALEQQRQPPQAAHTALLYCSGCLKNISADATNQKSLGRLGGVATMAQVLLDQQSIAGAVAAAQQQAGLEQQPQCARHPQHEAAAQVAVQASAVLRNLSVVTGNAGLFVQQQGLALRAVVGLLQPFQRDHEVLLNASRCLSKLSMYHSCRAGLLCLGLGDGQAHRGASRGGSAGGSGSPGRQSAAGGRGSCCATAVDQIVQALLGVVQAAQPRGWPLGVRLAFCLGQLTTFHAESRAQVAAVPGALDALPRLLLDLVEASQLQDLQGLAAAEAAPAAAAAAAVAALQEQQRQQQLLKEDLMTKLLRVLANLSIDRTVGPTLAAKQGTADAVLAVLTGFQYEHAEELVLNAAAALSNLSFYDTPSNKVLQSDADVLLVSLLPLLTSGNEESMCEAARAVGNLARASPAVRAALVLCDQEQQQQRDEAEEEVERDAAAAAAGPASSSSSCLSTTAGPFVLQSLVLLLDHSSWEVVGAVAGALVNLAACAEAGTALRQVGLAAALAGGLQRVVQEWWAVLEQGEEQCVACEQAAERLLQCVGNMVTCSAAAVSEAILGSGGARCAELSCGSEDLACFSAVVGSLAASAGDGGEGAEPADAGALQGMSNCIQQTAKSVQHSLRSLWGM